ncbi:hypothetical protein AB0L64_06100 [Kribbella sp. NPDC051936]|uniref:hypothetical protein n=1 Tax=Kribbella sp. NPDC051936 TaxID=3154946 RepID=UPI0034498B81
MSWVMLLMVVDRLTEQAEFVEARAYARHNPATSLRPRNGHLARSTTTVRERAYATTVLAVVTWLIGWRVVWNELEATVGWFRQSDPKDAADVIHALVDVLTDAGGVVSGAVVAANILVVALCLGALRLAVRQHDAWFAALSEHVLPELRILINREVTRWHPAELLVDTTPGLAGRDLPTPWIERASSQRVDRLITELGATAVAVSGRRGVGKTTLLRNMLETVVTPAPQPAVRGKQAMLAPLSVFVEAPVDYAPKDFLIDLFAQLCEKVIQVDPGRRFGPKSLPSRVVLRAVRFVGRVACVLFVLGAVVASPVEPQAEPEARWISESATSALHWVGIDVPLGPGMLGLLFLGAVGVGVGLGWITKPASGPLARRASTELAQLRYLQTLQSERSINLSRAFVALGFRRARQLAQQPMTLPELVRRYRAFAQQVADEPLPGKGVGLLVAIDEMDRIAEAESAEVFLNQIKATFGVPGSIYLVSVSEDALAHFERRVSTLRTTVDTSFDEVVWLPDFSLAESMDLLRSRLTGFPDLFLALCFCLSGGVPRDLLRAARSLVDARRDTGAEQLSDLTRSVVHAEVQSFGRGALRSHMISPSGPAKAPETFIELLANQPRVRAGKLMDVFETVSQHTGDEVQEYAAVLSYYATIEWMFVERRDIVEAALVESPDETALRVVEDLAAARAMLAISPQLATARLAEIRRTVSSQSGTGVS